MGERLKPGPKPGQRHSGQFQGGPDSRRWLHGPRSPTVTKDFQSKVKEHTDVAIKALADCVNDTSATWRERQAAAELLLAHGHGKPVDRVLMSQTATTNKASAISRMLELMDTPPESS